MCSVPCRAPEPRTVSACLCGEGGCARCPPGGSPCCLLCPFLLTTPPPSLPVPLFLLGLSARPEKRGLSYSTLGPGAAVPPSTKAAFSLLGFPPAPAPWASSPLECSHVRTHPRTHNPLLPQSSCLSCTRHLRPVGVTARCPLLPWSTCSSSSRDPGGLGLHWVPQPLEGRGVAQASSGGPQRPLTHLLHSAFSQTGEIPEVAHLQGHFPSKWDTQGGVKIRLCLKLFCDPGAQTSPTLSLNLPLCAAVL